MYLKNTVTFLGITDIVEKCIVIYLKRYKF